MMRFLIFVIVSFFSITVYSQVLRPKATATLNSTTDADCFGALGSSNVQLTLSSVASGVVIGGYTLVLNKDGVYYSTITNSTIQSGLSIAVNIPNLPVGSYTLTGSVISYNTTNSTSTALSFTSINFFVGYKSVWSEIKEMTIQTVSSKVLQNVVTPSSTYTAARSANFDIGDFWTMITPFFNSSITTNRSVYVSLQNSAALVSFNPSTQNSYLEFRKAGSDPNTGDGVYYKSSSGIFKLIGVTFTDKIRIVKTSNNITFYNGLSLTPLATSTNNPYTVSFSTSPIFTVFTTKQNDGVDMISSFKCNSSNEAFATLNYELDGAYYTVKNGKLRFIYSNSYDTQNNLKFSIYNSYGLNYKSQTDYPAVQVTNGDNFLTLDLTTTNGCLGVGMFYLEVVSDKKEKMFLRFYNEYDQCLPVGVPNGNNY